MQRIPRDPIRFDLIDAFAAFGKEEKVSLHDPAARSGFVDRVRTSVATSLGNEALLHGLRTQSMFEALVASLDAAEIIKAEDAGAIYVSDTRLKVPDFRLVLKDGSQMLVEVKNFYQGQREKAKRPFEFDRDYFDGLVLYAAATKSTLFIAIHWAVWNIWTLNRPDVFQRDGEKVVVSLFEAMRANHMAILGDVSIGTRFPLSMVMVADKTKPRTVEADNSANFTIGKVELYCEGRLIEDPVEKSIATYLMFFNTWEYQVVPKLGGNQIESVEHRWAPPEDHDQGFEIVGSLSGMFSMFYKVATQDEDRIENIQIEASSRWGRLIPDDYKGKALPLWRFTLKPASPGSENTEKV
jgi:hypothetical protein